MNNIITALIIVLSINVMLYASQNAICEMEYGGDCPADATRFYTGEGGIIEHKDINNTNVYDDLPKSGGSVQGDSGNIFTDVTGTILSWLGKIPGFDTIIATARTPYLFLKAMGLPPGWANAIGTFWYLVTLGLLFLVITGRY